MYNLKPIIGKNMIIDLPTCMYTMKSVYATNTDHSIFDSSAPVDGVAASNIGDNNSFRSVDVSERKNPFMAIERQVNSVLKQSDANDLVQLEIRQQKILQQLKELKTMIMLIHQNLNICAKPAQLIGAVNTDSSVATGKIQPKPIQMKSLQEIVININPSNIPYSLLAIKKLWQTRLHLRVQTFTHSSLFEELSTKACEFSAALTAPATNASNQQPEISVVVIWKSIPNIELIYSSTSYPILGEVNVLRYLMRIGPNELCYESYHDECMDIDATLDACYMLTNQNTTGKTKQSILKSLNTKLEKQQYFGGTGASITDIAVCSAIAQCNESLINDLPATMTKWCSNVRDFF